VAGVTYQTPHLTFGTLPPKGMKNKNNTLTEKGVLSMDEYLRKWWVLYGAFVDEPKIFVAFCWVVFFGCHIRHRHLKL